MKRRPVYPDSNDVLSQNGTTKVWTITTDNGDHVSTSYDRLGRTTSTTDQRGVVHDYAFDSAGRLAADTATSLGSSGIVDGTVRHIGKGYDDRRPRADGDQLLRHVRHDRRQPDRV